MYQSNLYARESIVVKTDEGWRRVETLGEAQSSLIDAMLASRPRCLTAGWMSPYHLALEMSYFGISLSECWRDNPQRTQEVLSRQRQALRVHSNDQELESLRKLIVQASRGPYELLEVLGEMEQECGASLAS